MDKQSVFQTDERPESLLRTLEQMEQDLDRCIGALRPTLGGERYLTDRELSERLKISRRTLQEYRAGSPITASAARCSTVSRISNGCWKSTISPCRDGGGPCRQTKDGPECSGPSLARQRGGWNYSAFRKSMVVSRLLYTHDK